MEDSSAAPVETILAQSASLGFYQKRLFVCSCFLQALTVSALIYASHCRPDLSRPSSSASPTATNGALVHSKCGASSRSKERSDETLLSRNETSTVRLLSSSVKDGNSEVTLGVGKRPTVSTQSTLSLEDSSGIPSSEMARQTVMGKRSNVMLDVSTLAMDKGASTQLVTHKHRHRSSKARDRGLRERSDLERISEDKEVRLTPSSLHEVVVNTYVEVVQPQSYPEEAEHQDYLSDDVEVYDYEWRDDVISSLTTKHDLVAEHLDSTNSKTGTTVVTSRMSSSQSASRSGVNSADVTIPIPDNQGCVEAGEDFQEEQESGLLYLSMTYLPAPEWLGREIQDPDQLARYNAYCQAVGAMVGATVGAMGADHVGRRRSLYVYFSLMLLVQCLSGVAVSWTMLAVLRFLLGVFAGACAVVSLVFPLEFIGAEWRDACVCSGLWVVGAMVISMELLVTRHWRYLAFISGGVGLPLLGTYFIASESARWLLCHQKFPDAESTLKEIISCNSTTVPDFLSLFDKSRTCVVTTMHPKRYTLLDLFHSLEMTKWTLVLLYTCLVGSSVYFCLLAKVKVMTGNVYLDTSLPFVIDLPLGWSAVVVNRCLGRRWCLFLYAVASGLALVSVLVLHVTGNLSHMPSMVTGMALFGKIGVTASLGLVFVLAVEMYPTVVRCMGVAVGLVGVAGGFLLSELLVFLEAYHYTVPFVVFGGMMSSVGFAGLLFPETLYCPLPNILPCRHRTIPLYEGVRLVSNPWDVL